MGACFIYSEIVLYQSSLAHRAKEQTLGSSLLLNHTDLEVKSIFPNTETLDDYNAVQEETPSSL